MPTLREALVELLRMRDRGWTHRVVHQPCRHIQIVAELRSERIDTAHKPSNTPVGKGCPAKAHEALKAETAARVRRRELHSRQKPLQNRLLLSNDLAFSGLVPSASEDQVRCNAWLGGNSHGPLTILPARRSNMTSMVASGRSGGEAGQRRSTL